MIAILSLDSFRSWLTTFRIFVINLNLSVASVVAPTKDYRRSAKVDGVYPYITSNGECVVASLID
jgi:hypothetical protein